jgi:hypothetical protein
MKKHHLYHVTMWFLRYFTQIHDFAFAAWDTIISHGRSTTWDVIVSHAYANLDPRAFRSPGSRLTLTRDTWTQRSETIWRSPAVVCNFVQKIYWFKFNQRCSRRMLPCCPSKGHIFSNILKRKRQKLRYT